MIYYNRNKNKRDISSFVSRKKQMARNSIDEFLNEKKALKYSISKILFIFLFNYPCLLDFGLQSNQLVGQQCG
jgi:hypothetical protein